MRCISWRSRSTRPATTRSARTSVLRALEEAPNYEKAQTLLLTLYDARDPTAEGKAMRSTAIAAPSLRLLCAFATARFGAAARRRRGHFDRYFGSPDDLYQPPEFHGNVPYDGRFTFARIKYRGYEHWAGREGPGWSHDYPDAEENFTKILRDITNVRPFIEAGPMVGSVLVALDDPRCSSIR